MQILVISPEYIIPWEQPYEAGSFQRRAFEEKEKSRSIDGILAEAKAAPFRGFGMEREDTGAGWSNVPLIPVFDAPEDLLHLGFFIVYNGNHRRFAANKAGISIPVLLLENGADLEALKKYRARECKKLLEGLSFDETRKIIWENARKYVNHEMQLPF
ncbi:MAG: hypothetical protein KJ955_03375 [Nanoarchaeota archaeon]|nr:hypothetical protein [Nanoarchaeota archaeon]